MNDPLAIKYSTRTCQITDQQGKVVGKIQMQRNPIFLTWKIKYLSANLPISSDDTVEQIKDQLLKHGLQWHWGELKHYYGASKN